MQIQVNTGHNIAGSEDLQRRIEADVAAALERFSAYITRVEVHLTDENGSKSGAADKRCMMEARPAGRPPVAVTNEAATLEDAFDGAAKKLHRLLESTLARENDHKGAPSIRTDEAFE